MVVALYPGSFDPVTKGHMDIAERAAKVFDRLIVAVYDTPSKSLMFTTQERVELVVKALEHIHNVKVISFTGLTVDAARANGAKVVIRGLRTGLDFEYEFGMAFMNKRLGPDIEFLYMMTSSSYQFVSSSLIKEVVRLGGNIEGLVAEHVDRALKRKLGLSQ